MTLNYLKEQNAHERDKDIDLDEATHIYTIKGDKSYTSTTTFIHKNFEKFDSDKIIDNMMKSKNWVNSKYYGKTKEEIKEGWEINRIESSTAGTKLHHDIESFYNGCPTVQGSTCDIEYRYFIDFHFKSKHTVGLKPYRTEWMVYDEEYKIAGSIDMIFENKDGTLQIYDWKRCKEITKVNRWNKFSTNPIIEDIPDTNFWHYTLQLNTYKYILEKNYGKTISDMYLVVLHPNNDSYKRIRVPNINNTIIKLFKNKV